MYAIKTEKLTKKYKEKTAVSNLDLKINEGEMYGLLGVNGAGKTTTMKMLTTLIMPTSGEAELLGHSIKTDRAAVKQIIGITFILDFIIICPECIHTFLQFGLLFQDITLLLKFQIFRALLYSFQKPFNTFLYCIWFHFMPP